MVKIIRKFRHPLWKKSAPWLVLVDENRDVWLDTGDLYCSLLGKYAPDFTRPVSPGWTKRYKITKANILKFAGC